MDEGFPGERGKGEERYDNTTTLALHLDWPLSQWRALRVVDPPRPIPNRVVKHHSVEGTGASWETRSARPPIAAWSSGSSSGS